jgi:hypothetical protein
MSDHGLHFFRLEIFSRKLKDQGYIHVIGFVRLNSPDSLYTPDVRLHIVFWYINPSRVPPANLLIDLLGLSGEKPINGNTGGFPAGQVTGTFEEERRYMFQGATRRMGS